MRTAWLAYLLLLFALPCLAGMEGALPGATNCNIKVPPSGAGVNSNHGRLMRVFPRKEEIPTAYTGCQTLWLERAVGSKDFERVWVLHFENGVVVADQTTGSLGEQLCLYVRGVLKPSQPQECSSSAPQAFDSLPPGAGVDR